MRGKIYGIGVGPGDPELMTLKACRLIRECGMIAVPGKDPYASAAYRIAAGAEPRIHDKPCIGIDLPMVKDRELIRTYHRRAASQLGEILDRGTDIAYLTLGDVTIYCTFSYLQHILEKDGYEVELVSGISSVTAAAARLNLPLSEWDEELHIIPGVHTQMDAIELPGTLVIMKSASRMKQVKDLLLKSGKKVQAVENCGMENEKLYRSCEEIPDDAGYFSLIIATDRGEEP